MKNVTLFFLYFAASALLTWFFIALSPLYISDEQMWLSTFIAGGKWTIQIILGILFLKEKTWPFLRKIGFVCFVGSLILVPFIISAVANWSDSGKFFFGSLVAAVLVMIFVYYKSIRALNLSLKWWFFWLICLAIAISLQLTVVFHIFS